MNCVYARLVQNVTARHVYRVRHTQPCMVPQNPQTALEAVGASSSRRQAKPDRQATETSFAVFFPKT
jgi:hypothetical protein